MAREITSPNAAAIDGLLKTVRSADVKTATASFRELERAHDTYPRFRLEDAERIFQECQHCIRDSKNPVARYNALRLLKYVVTTEDFLRARAEDLWALYKQTIFDPNGHVRNAGYQLLARYSFGMSFLADPYPFHKRQWGKKRTEETHRFQKMLVEQCLELFEMERTYRKEHPDREEEEAERRWNLVRGSWDTKDKFLKTIRRGMEEVTKGTYIERFAAKHGYTLPDHWLIEYDEEEPTMPPGTEGDLAGALFDATGGQPVLVSDPPDPKSFSSFEEYQEALDLRDTFLQHVQTIGDILTSDQTQEEIDEAMEALGFEKHDDAPCNRSWCIERYGCVAMTLMGVLREIEDSFLGDLPVASNQLLLSDAEWERCEEIGCHALPAEWFNEDAKKQPVFRWFMDLVDNLEMNKRIVPFAFLANDPLEEAFVREAYLYTLSVLRERPWPTQKEGTALITGFLASTDLLEEADDLRERFERLQAKR